jgi:Stage II sporulation protein P (SpoIIP).
MVIIMVNNQLKRKIKIYPILWSAILVVSLYVIYRFAALTFSFNIGQAESSIMDTLTLNLCCQVMGEGSALVQYTTEGEQGFSNPIDIMTDKLAIHKYVLNNNVITADAKDKSSKTGKNGITQTNQQDKTALETMSNHTISDSMNYDQIDAGLSKEYIMTNGLVYNDTLTNVVSNNPSNVVSNPPSPTEVAETEDSGDNVVETVNSNVSEKYTLDQLKNYNFLVNNFYIVHPSTKVTKNLFDGEKLLSKDMKIKQKNDKPQILILHTHAHEAFIDSREGKMEDTVVGVGTELTNILENTYHYNVIHDTTGYDIVNGVLDRSYAYNQALDGMNNILKQYPSIEVIIDLHRDQGDTRNVTINGKETAQVMLFNGLSRDKEGPIERLPNSNLQNNLAFSLQMQLKARDIYPGLFKKNYLKPLRFNMHVLPKYLLVELGTQNNTLQSEKNAMAPFAKVLDSVLQGK